MISDVDVTKLKKVFATKAEFSDLNDRVYSIETKMDRVLNTLDHIVGGIQDLREDNAVGVHIFARQERQIEALAVHSGITLPD